MTAALPMYDRPETEAANQKLWCVIRANLSEMWRDAGERGWSLPDRLTQPEDLWSHWMDPGLTLSQTCGLPFRDRLKDVVTLVGTADYGLPDCPPGHYNSVFVIRADDGRDRPDDWAGMTLACNSRNSQSGWAAPANYLAAEGLGFEDIVLTGAHRASANAVARGEADVACIDAQTWRMICRWDPEVAAALREVGRTAPTPGLPFITAGTHPAGDLRLALADAIRSLSDEDRAVLDMQDFVVLDADRYYAVPTPPFPKASARKID